MLEGTGQRSVLNILEMKKEVLTRIITSSFLTAVNVNVVLVSQIKSLGIVAFVKTYSIPGTSSRLNRGVMGLQSGLC